MKELRNNFDTEVCFSDLEEAKRYYYNDAEFPCGREEYLGDDWNDYCEQWKAYNNGIKEADSLEEFAEVLNTYTDVFDNGSEFYVKEF